MMEVGEFMIQKSKSDDERVKLCDRLDRLGIARAERKFEPMIFITDGKRQYRLIDVLDRFIELVERLDGRSHE
jgi:hypothetical protein